MLSSTSRMLGLLKFCLMRLLRILLLAVVRHSFSQQLQGVTNQSADALSHCRWQEPQVAGSKYSTLSNFDADSSRPAYRLDFPDLQQQCYSFRTRGLAPLIRHSYASAQAKFISFCRQLGNLHPSRSPCLMDEWTLCLIVCFWPGLCSIC